MKYSLVTFLMALGLILGPRALAQDPQRANKLLEMYRFYYLPFDLDFREGATVNDIFPYTRNPAGDYSRPVKPEELKALNQEWDVLKNDWQKRSLLLTTPVALNGSVDITSHLISHRLSFDRNAIDELPFNERLKLSDLLKDKATAVQTAALQLQFMHSLMSSGEKTEPEGSFHFFILSPSWCQSSREYRALFEEYFKRFPDARVTLHSIVIDDPKEQIFDGALFKQLFPNPLKYSHELVPRFLAVETVHGRSKVWEEGEALEALYTRFYQSHRGFLNQKYPIPQMAELQASLSDIR